MFDLVIFTKIGTRRELRKILLEMDPKKLYNRIGILLVY